MHRVLSDVESNFKRVTVSYDEEMTARQSYANPPEVRPEIKPVDFEEAIGEREEQNYSAAEGRRWREQYHFMGKKNVTSRLVRIMDPHEVFYRLRHAGVDARIEPPHFDVWMTDDSTGKPTLLRKERSTGRLWLHDDVVRGRVGVSAWVIENGERVRKMITTLQYPYGPEWSLLHFDKFNVPLAERYRGWRTAMLALILADVITEAEVDRAFGPVALGSVSLLYRERLFHHRQKKAGLVP